VTLKELIDVGWVEAGQEVIERKISGAISTNFTRTAICDAEIGLNTRLAF
jgi:hypothetical protein